MIEFIHNIKRNLQSNLPGKSSHHKMAHIVRQKEYAVPADAKKSAVLALFYPGHNQKISIALIQRTSKNPNDVHGGQIGLPGGRMETIDKDLKDTALREAWEEIGVNPKDISVLGSLTKLYIPVSKYEVEPYVGIINYKPEFIRQEEEVEAIIEVPFEILKDINSVKTKDIKITSTITLKEVPYFEYLNHTIWGATAMILQELVDVYHLSLK